MHQAQGSPTALSAWPVFLVVVSDLRNVQFVFQVHTPQRRWQLTVFLAHLAFTQPEQRSIACNVCMEHMLRVPSYRAAQIVALDFLVQLSTLPIALNALREPSRRCQASPPA